MTLQGSYVEDSNVHTNTKGGVVMRKQLHNTYGDQSVQRRRFSPLASLGVLVSVVLALIAGTIFVLPYLRSHTASSHTASSQAAPSLPYFERQELITDQCSTKPEGCGWSDNKSRIVRTSDDTVYAAYVSEGDGTFQGKIWHLMQRQANGTWKEIGSGPAGSEPVSLLRAPDDSLYVVAFPQNDSLHVIHFTRTSSGFTSNDTLVPGFGTNPWDATYSGAGINTQGNIVITQTSWDKPNNRGQFARDIYWTYYNPTTNQWTNHDTPIDYSHRFLFVFAGKHNDLSFVGQRDEQRTVLGFSPNSKYGQHPCQSWALNNEVKYFHTDNVDTQPVSNLLIKEEYPQSCEFLIQQVNDAYIDTQGRMHILYMDQQNGGDHHAIIHNGVLIKDVLLPVQNIWYSRIIQDTTGRFYIITASDNTLIVYPGAADDTDGTQLDPAVNLTLARSTSCTNGGQCQNPFLAVPRGGTPLADYVDGIYNSGAGNEYVYFRLRLRGSGSRSTPTPISLAQTPTSPPQSRPTLVPLNTPTAAPLTSQSYSI